MMIKKRKLRKEFFKNNNNNKIQHLILLKEDFVGIPMNKIAKDDFKPEICYANYSQSPSYQSEQVAN